MGTEGYRGNIGDVFVKGDSMSDGEEAGWRRHVVRQLNGRAGERQDCAQFQIVNDHWASGSPEMPDVGFMPNLVYVPEKGRLLMSLDCMHSGRHTVLTTSDDGGATWSARRWVHTDAGGQADAVGVGLTYLGNGRLILNPETGSVRWFSSDYGETWESGGPTGAASEGKDLHGWDPLLVDTDSAGNVVRLVETLWNRTDIPWGSAGVRLTQCHVRFSTDLGRSWTSEIKVPQWFGVSEAPLVRAANGDIVAACRTRYPKRFADLRFDHYSGLGVSISSDNGLTWSDVLMLYEWGRHNASMVVLPDGDIVMCYVVRLGYTDASDGFPRFGIEAVVSHDHGKTWDLDHRYLLCVWKGKIKGPLDWYGACQTTSTVLLGDGEILTAFGTGVRSVDSKVYNMEVGLVKWRVSDQPTDADRTLADAPYDSDVRNVFDPSVER